MHACHYVIRRQFSPMQRLKTRNLLIEVSASKDDAIGWEYVQSTKHIVCSCTQIFMSL
jgi:hypothetical protein